MVRPCAAEANATASLAMSSACPWSELYACMMHCKSYWNGLGFVPPPYSKRRNPLTRSWSVIGDGSLVPIPVGDKGVSRSARTSCAIFGGLSIGQTVVGSVIGHPSQPQPSTTHDASSRSESHAHQWDAHTTSGGCYRGLPTSPTRNALSEDGCPTSST